MPTNPYYIGALPVGAAADKSALRSGLALGAPLVLAASDNPTDIVAVDPATGATLRCIIFGGMVFALDAADTTSTHDGVSVLVSSDGKRYKRDGTNIGVPTSVLAVQNTPPGSPVVGDAYLVGTAPTGAWASRANFIAMRQSAGWVYIAPKVGWIVYVSGLDAFYRYTAAATWLQGVGSSALSASSVLASNLMVPPRFIVQNATTNTPPAVVNGVAYVVGPSPTGAWSGQTGKIAMGENGSWVFYTPSNGWTYFDISTFSSAVWSSGSWVLPAPAGYSNLVVITASGNWTPPAGVTRAEVTALGAGGGFGSSYPNGPGAGSLGIKNYTNLVPGTAYTVVIGAGGTGGTGGSNGGATSFAGPGTTLSAGGGQGAIAGGAAGAVTGADLVILGQSGTEGALPPLYSMARGKGYGYGGPSAVTLGGNGLIVIRY